MPTVRLLRAPALATLLRKGRTNAIGSIRRYATAAACARRHASCAPYRSARASSPPRLLRSCVRRCESAAARYGQPPSVRVFRRHELCFASSARAACLRFTRKAGTSALRAQERTTFLCGRIGFFCLPTAFPACTIEIEQRGVCRTCIDRLCSKRIERDSRGRRSAGT